MESPQKDTKYTWKQSASVSSIQEIPAQCRCALQAIYRLSLLSVNALGDRRPAIPSRNHVPPFQFQVVIYM